MENILEKIKNIITDSIKFWELGRILFNVILVLIVIGFFITGIIHEKQLYRFCSRNCLDKFEADPDRYLLLPEPDSER